MTNYDLIVLIPWAIVSIVFVLICIRLQASARKSESYRPNRLGERMRP
jgi:beta-lactamase regulating signal transducer with metallopeptidase domain